MRTYGVERLGAFSDGVFAIVVTLLVLEIKLPDPPLPGQEIQQELVDNIPAFLGWLVSFVVLTRFWVIHNHVTDVLVRCSMHTIVANVAFLGSISLLPFTAHLVGTYEFETPWAFVIFCSSFGLSAFLLGLLARHVTRAGHLRREVEHGLDWDWRYHSLVVPGIVVVASVVCFVHPVWSLAILTAESFGTLFLRLRTARVEPVG
jgi:uncharacterized membrane protein